VSRCSVPCSSGPVAAEWGFTGMLVSCYVRGSRQRVCCSQPAGSEHRCRQCWMQHAGCVVCLVLGLAGLLFCQKQPIVVLDAVGLSAAHSCCRQYWMRRQLVGCSMQVSSGVAHTSTARFGSCCSSCSQCWMRQLTAAHLTRQEGHRQHTVCFLQGVCNTCGPLQR
jgi:hypothetical protein